MQALYQPILITSKLTVKEVVTKQSIVNAEVTGAKKIELTMAKDVASVETPVAITVKKGTATKDVKTKTAEGKKITIETDTKLTAGDYTVTITGMENMQTDPLTATVNVAQNETLTKFEIGKELIAQSTDNTTDGYIYYSARNQYGERMNANQPTASVSFSNNVGIEKVATATADGKIYVRDMNDAMAILGVKGTCVLVDNNTGVNNTQEVVYSAAATAADVEIAGTYDTIHSKVADMTAGDNANNYYLLMTFKDQYGYTMGRDNTLIADVLKDGITVAGGVTKLEKFDTDEDATKEVVIDGKEYIALMFKNANNEPLVAGSATMTIVNNRRGLLKTEAIKVVPFVAIASFSANADDSLYDDQDNELNFEAIDTEGNSVKDYATLTKLVRSSGDDNNIGWRFVRQTDGTAKMVAKPFENINYTNSTSSSNTATKTISQSYALNDPVSGNYKIHTQLYTVSEERFIKKGHGLAAGTSTQVAKGRTLKIGFNKFVYEDQYSNKLKDGDGNYVQTIVTGAAAESQASISITSESGMTVTINTGDSLEFNATKPSVSATVYVKYHTALKTNEDDWTASDKNYDFKFTVNSVDTSEASSSTLKLVDIFGGYQQKVNLDEASGITNGSINVEVLQGGAWTRVPDSQITINSTKDDKIVNGDKVNGNQVDKKEATVNFTVTTYDSDNNPTYTDMSGKWTISTKEAELYKVDSVSNGALAINANSTGSITAASFYSLFKYKDQYGKDFTPDATSAGSLKYTVDVEQGQAAIRVHGQNSNDVWIENLAPGVDHYVKVKITVVAPDGSTKDTSREITWV